MSQTVVALFGEFDVAERAVESLQKSGFAHSQISMVAANRNSEFGVSSRENADVTVTTLPDFGPVAIAGPVAAIASQSGNPLGNAIGQDEMMRFVGGVQSGGTIIAVHTSAEQTQKATNCLERYGATALSSEVTRHTFDALEAAAVDDAELAAHGLATAH